jgi:hypothetical protein
MSTASGLPAPDFNAPPGVRWSDPYFNPPDPGEWDEDALLDYVENELVGDLIVEADDGTWQIELVHDDYPKGWAYVGEFATEHDAIAYFIAEREDWIEEKLDERERERLADGYYDEDEPGMP